METLLSLLNQLPFHPLVSLAIIIVVIAVAWGVISRLLRMAWKTITSVFTLLLAILICGGIGYFLLNGFSFGP